MNDVANDLTAIIGEVKSVSVKGVIYNVTACSLSDMPVLQKLLNEFGKADLNKSDSEMMVDDKSLTLMAKIILMGIKEKHPKITLDEIKNSFSLGAFPVIMKIMMDLNDFLLGMRELRSERRNMEAMAG